MSKELESLIRLEHSSKRYKGRKEDLDTIFTALKENGKLKECYKNELKNSAYYNNLALKYKKALEIFKEKILDMDYFNIIADRCDLTYQEYELLRKVLK